MLRTQTAEIERVCPDDDFEEELERAKDELDEASSSGNKLAVTIDMLKKFREKAEQKSACPLCKKPHDDMESFLKGMDLNIAK